MAAPRRRRRNQNSFLDNVGRISPSTMAMFGIAVLLLIASAGIIGLTVVRRSSANTAENLPTMEPTSFVAIVETPVPTPDTGTPTPTPRVSPTVRTSATAATPQRTSTVHTTVTVAAGALGSGQSKGARGIAGSMASTLGGALPPAQAAAVPAQPTAPAVIPGIPTPTYSPPTPTRTATRAPSGNTGGGSTGGGNTGGGSTGGGNTGGGIVPTSTPTRLPTATATTPPTPTRAPTATATATPRPTPPVAFPGPGSKAYSYNLTYVQTADLASAPTSDNAYTLSWGKFTQADVQNIAAKLGLSGTATPSGDGYKVSDPAKGDLVVNNTSGLLRFTAKGFAADPQVAAFAATPTVGPNPWVFASPTVSPSAGPSAAPSAAPSPSSSAAPSAAPSPSPSAAPSAGPSAAPRVDDQKARDLARAWLTQAGILPEGMDDGRVTRPTPDQIIVAFHIKTLSATVTDPAITVTLGTDGAVHVVNARWPSNISKAPTALRTAQSAWQSWLTDEKTGYLEVDQTVPADSKTVFTGTANVTNVSVGWGFASETVNGVTTNYLLPVFVFEGKVTLDNPAPGQDKTQNFRVYVQATP